MEAMCCVTQGVWARTRDMSCAGFVFLDRYQELLLVVLGKSAACHTLQPASGFKHWITTLAKDSVWQAWDVSHSHLCMCRPPRDSSILWTSCVRRLPRTKQRSRSGESRDWLTAGCAALQLLTSSAQAAC